MTLLAGFAVGVFVYFLVGYATGYTPDIKIRRFRRRTQISNRQLWLNQAGVEVRNTHLRHVAAPVKTMGAHRFGERGPSTMSVALLPTRARARADATSGGPHEAEKGPPPATTRRSAR
jgi:hypothetical protein